MKIVLIVLVVFMISNASCVENEMNSKNEIEEKTKVVTNDFVQQDLNKKRINRIENWTEIINKGTESNFSTEGGELVYFLNKGTIEKIEGQFMGETYNKKVTYYLYNNNVSIVNEVLESYNRPFYWDSITMKQQEDDEVFDPTKSTTILTQSYFTNNKLLKKVNQENVIIALSDDEKKETEERLVEEFKAVVNYFSTQQE